VAGKVEPVFVEKVADVPAAVRDLVQAGDVVLVMGAGSIGQVAPALGAHDSTGAPAPGGPQSSLGGKHAA
jgi:UDP-N-acetylmuramate--alanine ligase